MRSHYDQVADALYITLRDGEVARTLQLDPGTLVDVDQHGVPVGVEVLHPARDWPETQLLEAGVDRGSLELMLQLRGGGDTYRRFAHTHGPVLIA
jgi:uncharacterized protein YuzE